MSMFSGWNAGAVVGDLNEHFAPHAAGADPNVAALLAVALQRLEGVDEQVQQHLADLGLHARRHAGCGSWSCSTAMPLPLESAVQDFEAVVDQIGDGRFPGVAARRCGPSRASYGRCA